MLSTELEEEEGRSGDDKGVDIISSDCLPMDGGGDWLSCRCKGRIDPTSFINLSFEATGGLDFPLGPRRTMNIAAFMKVNPPLLFLAFSPSVGVFLPFVAVGGTVGTTLVAVAATIDLTSIRWKTMEDNGPLSYALIALQNAGRLGEGKL